MNEQGKKIYEPPRIEIIEFELKESIASSADHGSNVVCSETTWGEDW